MRKYLKVVRENYDEDKEHARMGREDNINKLIHHAFDSIGLPIETSGFGVIYDEDNGRGAVVTLKDNVYGYSTQLLSNLEKTGLSNEYLVRPSSNELEIVFIVNPNLDTGYIS